MWEHYNKKRYNKLQINFGFVGSLYKIKIWCVLFTISLSCGIALCAASRWLQYGSSSYVGFRKGVSSLVRYLGNLRFQNEPENKNKPLKKLIMNTSVMR